MNRDFMAEFRELRDGPQPRPALWPSYVQHWPQAHRPRTHHRLIATVAGSVVCFLLFVALLIELLSFAK
jgi:hypothetical protein